MPPEGSLSFLGEEIFLLKNAEGDTRELSGCLCIIVNCVIGLIRVIVDLRELYYSFVYG